MTNHLSFTLKESDLQEINNFSSALALSKYKKVAVVVQGGGQRGIFTAGVFDAFLEANFDPFDLYIGTSAGALNLSSYISRQPRFGYHFIVDYTTHDNFFNLYKYLSKQKPMNLDWAIDCVSPSGITPLDFERARQVLAGKEALASATRKDTLDDIYLPMFGSDWHDVLRATCAIPVLYNQPVNINDLEWVDGGVSAAVPVQEAWRRGADLVVVIRTEPVEEQDEWDDLFNDWRDKIEQSLPQYLEKLNIEKLNLNESLDKLRTARSDFRLRFQQWKQSWHDDPIAEQDADFSDELVAKLSTPEKVKLLLQDHKHHRLARSDNGSWKWLKHNNIERFLKLTGKGKNADVLEMLTKYYKSYQDQCDFLSNLPEGLKVIQIAPEKGLKSRALLSDRDDLEVDYRQGKIVGREFVSHFAELIRNTEQAK
ncbi:patatin family protein [Photobacterium jeanii]|uniref:Patatin family protein n=1 Tax=Photobacterium jeanii TaxID=858640 RepID=A0A178KM13_9GAMM|nr:patatin-like phospholipase family protein [Photobacterium jeanii]OAN17713.1 patatin family protein [Photobacterium jeanii]PST92626.1 patatin family protein [Photobacterium jeanii]